MATQAGLSPHMIMGLEMLSTGTRGYSTLKAWGVGKRTIGALIVRGLVVPHPRRVGLVAITGKGWDALPDRAKHSALRLGHVEANYEQAERLTATAI